jgi:hypothetical protein
MRTTRMEHLNSPDSPDSPDSHLNKKLNTVPSYRMIVAPPNSPHPTSMNPSDTVLDSMDLSALSRALPTVSTVPTTTSRRPTYRLPLLYCAHCNQRYLPFWYDLTHYRCFFCMRFRSPNITRYALLYETQWYFIQSGEDDPHVYYATYFELLHRWADQRQLPFTPREAEYQEYLWHMIRE